MCLIVTSDSGKMPSNEVLGYSHKMNSDGWGIVYFDGYSPKVEKGFRLNSMLDRCKMVEYNAYPYILHMRLCTHGNVDRENTHPFKLSNGAWLAHNGIISIELAEKGKSDTWHFAKLVSDLLMADTEAEPWFGTESFIAEMEKYIGRSNKLAFMDKSGKILHANREMGLEVGDVWYSNTYSLPATFHGDAGWFYGDEDVDCLSENDWRNYVPKTKGYGYAGYGHTARTYPISYMNESGKQTLLSSDARELLLDQAPITEDDDRWDKIEQSVKEYLTDRNSLLLPSYQERAESLIGFPATNMYTDDGDMLREDIDGNVIIMGNS